MNPRETWCSLLLWNELLLVDEDGLLLKSSERIQSEVIHEDDDE